MDKEKKVTVGSFVANRIKMISLDKSDAKGEAAVWRHAFAKPVCEDMKAWSLLERDIPQELAGFSGKPTEKENAAYMAISAFAACGSNTPTVSLGQAVAALGENSRQRFTRLEKSKTINELWMNLKGLLRLVSSKNGRPDQNNS